jgi:hypothetical protein
MPERHQVADVSAMVRDAEYFAFELGRRLERLAQIQGGRRGQHWVQSAAVVRRVRGLAQDEIDRQHRVARAQEARIR